jgi:hypothetical protein
MYSGISHSALNKAAQHGTEVHDAIERYCKDGTDSDLSELRGYKVLEKHYGIKALRNEVPVVLFLDDKPIAAGRYDMEIFCYGEEGIGGADIKTTSTLHKEHLAFQLNLYRIANIQSYGVEWRFLRAIHLRDEVRKFVPIPIDEASAWDLIFEYLEANK